MVVAAVPSGVVPPHALSLPLDELALGEIEQRIDQALVGPSMLADGQGQIWLSMYCEPSLLSKAASLLRGRGLSIRHSEFTSDVEGNSRAYLLAAHQTR